MWDSNHAKSQVDWKSILYDIVYQKLVGKKWEKKQPTQGGHNNYSLLYCDVYCCIVIFFMVGSLVIGSSAL